MPRLFLLLTTSLATLSSLLLLQALRNLSQPLPMQAMGYLPCDERPMVELTTQQLEKIWYHKMNRLPHPTDCPMLTKDDLRDVMQLLNQLTQEKARSTVH